MSENFDKLTIKEMRKGLDNGDFTSVELTKYFLSNSKKKNEEINAYLEIYDDALESAKEADERIKKGEVEAEELVSAVTNKLTPETVEGLLRED